MLTPRATCTSARVCVCVCVCVCVVGLGCPTVCFSVRCGSSLEREVREKERQGPVTLSLSGEVHHGWRERQSEREKEREGVRGVEREFITNDASNKTCLSYFLFL